MGCICWIFCFIFNAQRKLGGKFKFLDRHCNCFSSFEKIRAHITTGRKGKVILMAPFLFSPPFSSPFSPHHDPAQWGTCPISVGPGSLHRLRQSLGQEGGGGCAVPGSSCCGPAALLPEVGTSGDHEQCHRDQLQTPLHLCRPHPEPHPQPGGLPLA